MTGELFYELHKPVCRDIHRSHLPFGWSGDELVQNLSAAVSVKA
jgi:hypothetical protein